ncbi:sulfatase [Horticoccus sp. 23ND18S-11]|uniref:sulfatase n=1 Tax=Horticoccus sp. 23ND18S-11 TaxID=3391832 RepID=UPI0039C92859
MNSRCRLHALVALFLALMASAVGATPSKPNVLFIAVDDLRDWVGYFGHNPQTKTPNFDRLAKMGVSFTRAYCASPVCNPSRAALMSGLRPSTSAVYENNIDFRPLLPESKMLTTAFRNAGYFVHGSGKIYHESYRRRSEWDDYLDKEGGNPKVPAGQSDGVGGIKFAALDCKDEDISDYGIADYGIASLAKKHDKPFFLAVGFHKPHMPWNVPRKYFDLFPLESIKLPPYLENDLDDVPPAGVRMAHPETDHVPMVKSGRWKEAIQAYLATIAYCDMNLGRLLDAFEKSAYKDNTILCLWGDHGWHLGEKHHWRKFSLWEEATRSPLIWIVPGLTKPNTVCERTIDFMSIYPTLTDLCGIPTPTHNEGVSIRTLLGNPAAAWDQAGVTTYRYKNHTARTADWRYIRYANGDEELYDERKDPNEWTNLATKPEFAAKKTELAKFLPTQDAAETDSPASSQKKGQRKNKK